MELSKKEKEAIEIVNDLIEIIEEELQYENETYRRIDEEDWQSLKIVLNLISKLQKENEKQSKVIDETVDLISCECEDDWIVELYNIADGNINELVKQHFYRMVERK